jgi:TrmH family RNA methyltransferase
VATPPVIRSSANPLIRRVRLCLAGKDRQRMVLEGERLVEEARRAGHELELVLVAQSRLEQAQELADQGLAVRVVEDALLSRVSSLSSSPGILALCAVPRSMDLTRASLPGDALALVVGAVSDPGNLGALIRSAEAAGAACALLLHGGANPWSAKALRGSMGSLLRLPLCAGIPAREARDRLDRLGFAHLRAATRGGLPFDRADWSGRIALWISSEVGDLPGEVHDIQPISIPMAGRAESLNVTSAATLLLYAAGRAGSR